MHLERLRWVQLAAKGTRQTFAAKSLGKLWTAFRRCCSLIFSGVWTVAFWCCYYQTPLSWEFLFDLSMAGLHVQCEPCIHCPTEVQFFVPAIARVIVLWADCEDPMATGEPARHQVWPADAPVTSPLSEGFSFNVSTRRWLWLWGYEYLVQKIELHMNLIFDRPVYCRQTVFRLKFRLFCRLYTVGRL